MPGLTRYLQTNSNLMEPNALKSAASPFPAEIRAYLVEDPDLMIDPSSPPPTNALPAGLPKRPDAP